MALPARPGSRARLLPSLLALAATALLCVPACAPRQAGSPWQAVEVPTDADFSGLWFADTLHGWLAGGGWAIDGGIVGRTSDGGRTWRFESGILGHDPGAALARVRFRDAQQGWATASHGRVLVTGDGGESWRPARVHGGSGNMFDLQFLDERRGWAAGTRIAHTEDGGETWQTLTTSTSENGYLTANAIHFVDAYRGWLVSHSGLLMRTDDGGREWSPVALPLREGERPTLRDITFVDGARGWVAGERGSIFHTSDGGVSWERQEQGVPVVRVLAKGERPRRDILLELETEPDRLAVMAIAFADPMRGWAVGYYADVAESVVLGTENGGATWVTEHVQQGELLRSLFALDADHVWAAGDRARTRPQVVLRYSPAGR